MEGETILTVKEKTGKVILEASKNKFDSDVNMSLETENGELQEPKAFSPEFSGEDSILYFGPL